MKKVSLVILSCLMLACSDDDGGSGPDPNFDLVLGSWELSALRISPEQDIDEDGTPTSNILDELPCIDAEITLRSDNTWTFSGNDVIVTTITGGLFKFFCSDENRTAGGNWDINGSTVRLADGTGVVTSFSFNSSAGTLTNTTGESLPDLQAEVYSKVE